MRTLLPTIAGAALGAALVREIRTRRAAERFAAAALESLLYAIDANDADTGKHVRRVARYAGILADAAGFDREACLDVEHAALFHDIGKIHEALFDIVHDDATLTAEDRRAIATHPRRGARVLAPLTPFYPGLADAVLSHHERWDGTGYPRHLRGRAIPLTARIVSLADTFDAITHDRPYRGGQPPAAAIEAIASGRGTQFDPELVDLMLLPPVMARLVRARHQGAGHSLRHKGGERRTREHAALAPDVAFRWHSRPAAG